MQVWKKQGVNKELRRKLPESCARSVSSEMEQQGLKDENIM